jgi:hypothetical protein
MNEGKYLSALNKNPFFKNILFGNQFMNIIVPSQAFPHEYYRKGYP